MKKAISLVIALLSLMFLLCGCGDSAEHGSGSGYAAKGKFYSLEQAYNSGYLSETDLQSIAGFYNGDSSDNMALTAEENDTLKKDYCIQYFEDQSTPLDVISIGKYCGTYHGCIVTEIGTGCIAYDLLIEDEYTLGGAIFYNYWRLLVWSEREIPDLNLIKPSVEMSDDDLIAFHEHGKKFPANFVFAELEGYGRIVKSAETAEEAQQIVTGHFTNGQNSVVENDLFVETDLFYGIYVKWVHDSGSNTAPSEYDECVVSFKKNVYDSEKMQFGNVQAEAIKSILDYRHYSRHYQTGGAKVYGSRISGNDDCYVYTIEHLGVVYGDWGIQDWLTLYREEYRIEKNTGVCTQTKKEVLKTVGVDGYGILYRGVVGA